MLIPDTLPPLSPAEAAHSELVAGHLRKLIAAGGGDVVSVASEAGRRGLPNEAVHHDRP